MPKKKYVFFTVKDLKKLLEDIPDDTPIGSIGHFGELKPIEKGDIEIKKAHLVPYPDGWRRMENKETEVLSIYVDELGPDPD